MKLIEKLALDLDLRSEGIITAHEKSLYPDEYTDPKLWDTIIAKMENQTLNFDLPHMALIPKDEPGEFREVLIESRDGRIICSIINNALLKYFPNYIHKTCKSYQKGLSTGIPVMETSRAIVNSKTKNLKILKVDFHHYFDTIYKEKLYELLSKLERDQGYESNGDPVMQLIRRIYDNEFFIGTDKCVHKEWKGIRQGNPLAAFFANAMLYDVDEYMSKKYEYYCRYSDDSIILTDNPNEAIGDLIRLTKPYGVILNDKKTEIYNKNQYFKFLGYSIRGADITISKGRLHKFVREINIRTRSNDAKKNKKSVVRRVMKFLYGDPYKDGDNYSWATSILPIINVEEDIHELNMFVMDSIRCCITDNWAITTPGYESNKKFNGIRRRGVVSYSTISGSRPNAASSWLGEQIPIIDGYITLMDAKKLLKINKNLFNQKYRNMLNEGINK